MIDDTCLWVWNGQDEQRRITWATTCGETITEAEAGEADDLERCPHCGRELYSTRPVSSYDTGGQ